MEYVVVVKTIADENGKKNIVEKIPHTGEIQLQTMYKLCECSTIDIKEVPFRLQLLDKRSMSAVQRK